MAALMLTPEKLAAFCAALSEAGGSVTRACRAVGISRQTAYEWRSNSPEFAKAWEVAKAQGMDALEDEATRRAFEGFDKPVTFQGEVRDTVREYSDTLLIFLLKGGKPEKYRERAEISGPGGGPIELTEGERSARVAGLLALAQHRADHDAEGLT
ncbi:MAG: terminase [Burkholderiales bacterium 66-5]|nr:MAG: terminase [Burkholderiales bacterium 66-5]